MDNVHEGNQKISDLLRIKQAAEYIGVPVSTLRDWDRTGKLKAVRHPVNGYRLYQRSELERILEEVNKKR
jgi:excisionase family DNA binding protein